MLRKIREWLALVLIVFLPFHAFLVTFLTKVIAGSGHRPIAVLALWKEALLGILLLLAIVEIFQIYRRSESLRPRIDALDGCILLGILYAGMLEFFVESPFHAGFALGFKYDFLPLVAFFILRRVPWSDDFQIATRNILIAVGAVIALLGFIALVLPMRFFVALGYSDLHSLYLPDAPLAPFQMVGGTALRRMQSVMSGPNQLGLWLLLPIALLIPSVRKGKWQIPALLLLTIALACTFSRAAWIAAAVVAITSATITLKPEKRMRFFGITVSVLLCAGIVAAFLFPSVIFRAASSSDHLKRPLQAMQTMLRQPLGLGLGTAGPASNRTSDTCVEFAAGADISWAKDRTDICVFVGGVQKQPTERKCDCPLLTENWYLQWGVEMGVVGLVLSLMLPFFVLKKRKASSTKWKVSVLLAFLGIGIAGLFLHSFEDSAVAYTIWLLLAVVVPTVSQRGNVRA